MLLVAGKFDPSKTLGLIKQAFGLLSPAACWPPPTPPSPPRTASTR
ncbi:MAG: hypothetical protein ACRYFK_13695 [Janthinobacterium lividum]